MCGIAGFLHHDAAELPGVIDRQLELLAHRGPDSFGVVRGAGAVIGQTRLSIIDLVTGDPPIMNEDGKVGVAFNGEIYNFAALRDRLIDAGHVFRTEGDTEVIAHLAEGTDAVDLPRRLEGMFAFAVWDQKKRKLTLARDRLGKKPLYYWSDERNFVFASEIKALTSHPMVPRRLNASVLPAYLTFGYAPTPETFFEGIKSVPPGYVLEVEPGGTPRLRPYWQPAIPGFGDAPVVDLAFDEAASEVRLLLEAAVAKRLVADVPLGAFLSGGIDSSAVVGLMSSQMNDRVRTFTIGFDDDEGFDEREYARLVARRFGAEHTEFVVEPNAVDLIDDLVWSYDQPFGDSSAIPTFLLSKMTRQHVTVALSGDGGDELFAGYERFAAALAANRYVKIPQGARSLAQRVVAELPRGRVRDRTSSIQRFVAAADLGLPEAYRAWVSFIGADDRSALLGNGYSAVSDGYAQMWRESEGAATLDRLLLLNLKTYLADDLLPKVDRTSMAHGLEVRSPFLDHKLVEFALRLPPQYRLRGLNLKRILKAAVSDLLPKEVTHRRKRGFGVPLDRWFRTDLDTYVTSMLGPHARVRTHLQGAAIDRLLADHSAGRRHHGHTLWTLLTLEVFLRREGW